MGWCACARTLRSLPAADAWGRRAGAALGQRSQEPQPAEGRTATQGAGMMRRVFGHWIGSFAAKTAAAAALAACAVGAQDRADMDRTQIIGNRELPKVLYIVPWKKPVPGDMSGRPLDSVLDEALAPVDRDVFRRQVRYDALIHARFGQAVGKGDPE